MSLRGFTWKQDYDFMPLTIQVPCLGWWLLHKHINLDVVVKHIDVIWVYKQINVCAYNKEMELSCPVNIHKDIEHQALHK
jgi:hypothetical protein